MAILNPRDRTIECKIVYFGPGRGGKTTNLQYIHKVYEKQARGEMISINTKGDRTLFFDFLPMGLGQVRGCEVKVNIYTVPGQTKYASTRKLVLTGADGVVFVADSLKVRRRENLMSLRDMQQHLAEQNRSIFKLPLVLQYNKRDLARQGVPILPIEVMEQDLNSKLNVPSFSASALYGKGVGDTLKECLKRTLRHLQQEITW